MIYDLPQLTKKKLEKQLPLFSAHISSIWEGWLYNHTRSKKIGKFLEDELFFFLGESFSFTRGSTSSGLDFPDLLIDIKATDLKQPQSSAPFSSIRQKIFGLGYGVVLFVYQIRKDSSRKKGRLDIVASKLIDRSRTADTNLTNKLLSLKSLSDKRGVERLVWKEVESLYGDVSMVSSQWVEDLVKEIFESDLQPGQLTLSSALQWRVNYGRGPAEDFRDSVFDFFGCG